MKKRIDILLLRLLRNILNFEIELAIDDNYFEKTMALDVIEATIQELREELAKK